jgi:sugar fermentation stimulation protein A
VRYPSPLVEGVVLRRYKRFLVDVEVGGVVVTAHCPNPGRMTSAIADGAPCRLSESDAPGRKLRFTLEQVRMGDVWIGAHPGRANDVVAEVIGGLFGAPVRREVALPDGSRADFRVDTAPPTWVEVKQVSLRYDDGRGAFPDAPSPRAARHADALAGRVDAGERGEVWFLVPRADVDVVVPADDVDPAYGRALRAAVSRGVRVRALRARVDLDGITAAEDLEVRL